MPRVHDVEIDGLGKTDRLVQWPGALQARALDQLGRGVALAADRGQ